ncbi:MAG: hypothetical protein HY518_04685 [Candidatus Aenigmarchaeota archaeon]|nr:hypothetical protein [Candidatus Aenigmarchaeota archaeon]
MKAYIATNFMGAFAFDADGKLAGHVLFRKDPEAIAEALEKSKSGIIQEEDSLVEKLKESGYDEFVLDRDVTISGAKVSKDAENKGNKFLQSGFRKLALELKWVSSNQELNEIINRVNTLQTKGKLRETRKDRILINAITTLDEMDKSINVFSEKLREWFGLYCPEAERAVQSHEKLAEMVAKDPRMEKAASAGMGFSDNDLAAMQHFSKSLAAMFEAKRQLTGYIEALSSETIPNMSAVGGELLASRLVALAGGLEKMSRMPSSTVQLLGAEKALFRHLKGGGKAPKFGILFGHPHIQNAPKELKGKVARLIAAKLSIASRVDYFSKDNRGEKMRKELDEEVKSVLGRA